jgi:hypothetical protein
VQASTHRAYAGAAGEGKNRFNLSIGASYQWKLAAANGKRNANRHSNERR